MIQRSSRGVALAGNAIELQINQKQNIPRGEIKINMHVRWALGRPCVVGCLCLMFWMGALIHTYRAAGECQRPHTPPARPSTWRVKTFVNEKELHGGKGPPPLTPTPPRN